jgi:hypothetical protein
MVLFGYRNHAYRELRKDYTKCQYFFLYRALPDIIMTHEDLPVLCALIQVEPIYFSVKTGIAKVEHLVALKLRTIFH